MLVDVRNSWSIAPVICSAIWLQMLDDRLGFWVYSLKAPADRPYTIGITSEARKLRGLLPLLNKCDSTVILG
jgi:hypothetical protein